MKKIRFLSILLCLCLMISVITLPTAAETEAATEASVSTEASAATDETDAASAVSTKEIPGLPTPTESNLGPEYTVKAKAALLLELNSNTIIYQQNMNERLYPASLTKVMTCLLALEHGNLDDVLTVSETALSGLDIYGSSADLVVGEEINLRDLLYCIMLSSANEACNVVAEYVSGSIDDFVALMNQKAEELGCTDTHFANTNGLHDDNHYSSAYDLCQITRKALQNNSFWEISTATTYTVPATNLSDERRLVTTNYLVSTDTVSDYYYARAEGIKTGFTTPAGRCLISTATDGDLRFLSVVLGADTGQLSNGGVWYNSFSETKKLFQYGFENFAYAMVLTNLKNLDEVPVKFSAGRGSVPIKPSSDVYALLPKEYNPDLVSNEYVLNRPELQAHLDAGEIVGTVTVYYDGKPIGSTTVETLTAVERSELAYGLDQTKVFVQQYWWALLLLGGVIVLLLLVLIVKAVIYGHKRRVAMRKRRPGGQTNRSQSSVQNHSRSQRP